MKRYKVQIFAVISLFLFAIMTNNAECATVTGKMMSEDGKSLAYGFINFFNVATGPAPIPEKYYRIPDETKPLNKNGRFQFDLPAGKYYIGAFQSATTEDRFVPGPPRPGDLTLIVKDEAGLPKIFAIPAGGSENLGVLTGATPLKAPSSAETMTAVKGTIFDISGHPAMDKFLFAATTNEKYLNPLFISLPTKADGRYLMRFPEGGIYYLTIMGKNLPQNFALKTKPDQDAETFSRIKVEVKSDRITELDIYMTGSN